MDYLKAIDMRQSKRTFLKEPIKKGEIEALNEFIENVNKESNLHISLEEDASQAFEGFTKSYGLFKGVRTIIVVKGKADDEHLKEKCGYYGEKIVLKVTLMGLGSCWVGGTFQKGNKIFDNINSDEKLVCVIPIGYTPENPSNREKLIRSIMHRKSKSIEQMYVSDINVPQWFIEGMRAVTKAPTAVNTQRVVFEYSETGVKAGVPNKSVFDLVDLGICKLHFEIGSGKKVAFGNNFTS